MMKKIHALALIAIALTVAKIAAADAPDLIARGEYLERAGDCIVCHTGPGEKPFAGGLKMGTPLGAVYTTNITPDKETGIGAYSFEDFERAMRKGVGKDGHHLYPAMPYPSYAKISEDDLRALYAYFMQSVVPVKRQNTASDIPWPLNMRWPIAIWNIAFSAKPDYTPKPDHDAKWNRGAYLVQSLGHCGSCHTPRGIFFQEKGMDETKATYVQGGNLDNWYASSLRQDSLAGLKGWSEADIVAFLKTGRNDHATVFGTMIDVINNSTQYLSDDDLGAIAAYLKSLPGNSTGTTYAYDAKTFDKLHSGTADSAGARVYLQQCGDCHALDGMGRPPFLPPIAGNPVVMDSDPSSLINLALNGANRVVVGGMPDSYRMPEFRVQLKDQDIADSLNFIRKGWGNSATPVSAEQVAKIRKQTDPSSDEPVVLRMR
jgi:mono/diheme cytochrome c family protein